MHLATEATDSAHDVREKISRALTERAELMGEHVAGLRRVRGSMGKAQDGAEFILDEMVNALEREQKWLEDLALAIAPPVGST